MVSSSVNTPLVKEEFVNIIDHLGVGSRRVHKDVNKMFQELEGSLLMWLTQTDQVLRKGVNQGNVKLDHAGLHLDDKLDQLRVVNRQNSYQGCVVRKRVQTESP